MNEQQRQAYLEAMGIQVYYPRQPLKNARPSPAYEWPEPEPANAGAAAEQRPVGDHAGSGPARVVVDLDDSRRRRRQSQVDAPVAADQPDARSDAGSAEPALRFRLTYSQPVPGLAVLSEQPLERTADSPEVSQLLHNILLALAVDNAAENRQVEQFNWPLSEAMPAGEATAEHARQALGGFITMRQQRDGFTNLLVFSSRLAELLPGAARGQTSGDFPARKIHCQVTCVESLYAMLSLPELKKDVWRQLQPLRQRLSRP